MIRTLSRFAPALTLFLLSPLIGEFLLGNFAIDMWWLMAFVAPLYGAGALLVREAAPRWGAGWPGIFALGLAYGLIEEGLVTQSLYDPNYLGMRLLDYGHIPALGIGGWWTVFVLGLHMIWSTAAAIGLAEALWPRRAAEPWLPGAALPVTAAVFVVGCLATAWVGGGGFDASPAQAGVTIALVIALTAFARLMGRRPGKPPNERRAPSPFVTALASFALLSLLMLSTWSMASIAAGWNVAWMLAALGWLAVLASRWSRRQGWGASHRLALTAGALATYGWWSLLIPATVTHAGPTVDLIGNLACILGAALLVWLAARRIAAAAR